MKTFRNQAGFSLVEGVLVVAVIAVMAVVGMRVMSKNDSTTSSSTQTSSASVKAPQVESTKDLDTAAKTLDQNDPSSTNTADLDALDSQLQGIN